MHTSGVSRLIFMYHSTPHGIANTRDPSILTRATVPLQMCVYMAIFAAGSACGCWCCWCCCSCRYSCRSCSYILYPKVVNLVDSASVSFNVINSANINTVARSFCQRSRAHLETSRKACRVLEELRPSWFRASCCPAFLANPSAFPFVDELETSQIYPSNNVEYA